MKFHFAKIFFATTAIVTTALLVCCTKETDKSKGTQHGGGGSFQKSSAEHVQGALDKAIRLAMGNDPQKNIFAQFVLAWGIKNQDLVTSRLFPALAGLDLNSDFRLPENAAKLKSPALEALAKNKFDRKEVGDCLTTLKGEHKDASVSALSTDADVCFSIGNLTRVPPSSLYQQVFALLIHEASHMSGAEESEALKWQTEFASYFSTRFGDLSVNNVHTDTVKQIGRIREVYLKYHTLALSNPRHSDFNGIQLDDEQIKGLANLPNLLDPLALDLKLNPVSPELYSNYANSVLALIQNIRFMFKLRIAAPGAIPSRRVSADNMAETLATFLKQLDQVETNFHAYVQGGHRANSVCVLPEGDVDMSLFAQSAEKNMISAFLPPKSCRN